MGCKGRRDVLCVWASLFVCCGRILRVLMYVSTCVRSSIVRDAQLCMTIAQVTAMLAHIYTVFQLLREEILSRITLSGWVSVFVHTVAERAARTLEIATGAIPSS